MTLPAHRVRCAPRAPICARDAARSLPPVRGPIRSAARAWLRRYLLLELAGWLGGLGLGWLAHARCSGSEATALAGLLGESLGFYGLALCREMRAGPGRELRTALRRPLSLILCTRLATSPLVGLVVGGVAADAAYYSLAAWGSRHTLMAARGSAGSPTAGARPGPSRR